MEHYLGRLGRGGEKGNKLKRLSLAFALAGALGFALMRTGAGAQQPMSVVRAAPELVGGAWMNTPKNKPIRLAERKGKVTVVEFWTFG